jgi:signal transduction histidine kinase
MEERRNLYLLIKEAVNNVAKYAHAKRLLIVFRKEEKNLLVEVSDDGYGFDAKMVKDGNGLHNMQKRAKALNAKLTIESAPGKGTRVFLILPLG